MQCLLSPNTLPLFHQWIIPLGYLAFFKKLFLFSIYVMSRSETSLPLTFCFLIF